MSINGKQALNNAKKYCKKIAFVHEEKYGLDMQVTKIFNEIEADSLTGKINYQVTIPSNEIGQRSYDLKYIILELRTHGFNAYVRKINKEYIFSISIH